MQLDALVEGGRVAEEAGQFMYSKVISMRSYSNRLGLDPVYYVISGLDDVTHSARHDNDKRHAR